jgi:Secretion system C-terminal sorting domain
MYDSDHAIAGGANGTILVYSKHDNAWIKRWTGTQASINVQITPNPSSSNLQFSYTLTKGEHVTLTIFDATGATVATPLNYVYQSGRESVSFNAVNLASGSYFVRLQCEDYSTQGTFTVIHS